MYDIELKIDGYRCIYEEASSLQSAMERAQTCINVFVDPELPDPNLIQIYIRKQTTRRQNARHLTVPQHRVSIETAML